MGSNDHYLGEKARKILERVLDHAGRDLNSHLFKHSVKVGIQFNISKITKFLRKGKKTS